MQPHHEVSRNHDFLLSVAKAAHPCGRASCCHAVAPDVRYFALGVIAHLTRGEPECRPERIGVIEFLGSTTRGADNFDEIDHGILLPLPIRTTLSGRRSFWIANIIRVKMDVRKERGGKHLFSVNRINENRSRATVVS
jgi:hypothetical protein